MVPWDERGRARYACCTAGARRAKNFNKDADVASEDGARVATAATRGHCARRGYLGSVDPGRVCPWTIIDDIGRNGRREENAASLTPAARGGCGGCGGPRVVRSSTDTARPDRLLLLLPPMLPGKAPILGRNIATTAVGQW